MRKTVKVFALSAAASAAADLATKALVEGSIQPYQRVRIIDGLLDLVNVRNSGAAFGILAQGGKSSTVFFIAVTLVAMAVILWLVRRQASGSVTEALGLGLVFGGAAGNLMDRLRYGEVVDFIDAYWRSYHWPAFNVADIAICVGVGLLIIAELASARLRGN